MNSWSFRVSEKASFPLEKVMGCASEILFLKHESSIFRQSSCMWFLHDGTGYTLCCLAYGELARHLHEPHTGLDDCLNMLLSCFRNRLSDMHVRKCARNGSVAHAPALKFTMRHDALRQAKRRCRKRGNHKCVNSSTQNVAFLPREAGASRSISH